MHSSNQQAQNGSRRFAAIALLTGVAVCFSAAPRGLAEQAESAAPWRAGAASVDITPQELMWMAGYAARKKPADGYAQHLYAKALAIESGDGSRAVIVTTDVDGEPRYEFNGDYAGYAQEYLQQSHPDAIALFLHGCGGDQNPHPRRDMVPGVKPLEMAQHHGRTLSLAVEQVLNSPRRPVRGPIRSGFRDIEVIRTTDPIGPFEYPVQLLKFGSDLTLAALASDVVVDYSLRLKSELAATADDERNGPAVWVAGYSNGYFGYIPSVRILDEGGYEAGPWDASIEERIVGAVHSLNRGLAD